MPLSDVPPADALPTLYAIARLTTRFEDPTEAMQAILPVIAESLGASSGSIGLVNPDTGKLELEVRHNLPDDVDDLALRLGQGITGWVAFHAKAQLAPDVSADPRYIRLRPEVRAEMAAPMLAANGQVLGVLDLDSDVLGGFTSDNLSRLELYTAEIAPVMERLWQLRQLQAKARQLETLATSGVTLVAKLEQHELFDNLTHDARELLQGHACALYLHSSESDVLRCAFYSSAGSAPPPSGDQPLSSCLLASAVHTRHAVSFADIQSPEYHDVTDLPRDPALRSVLATPLLAEGEVLGVLAVFTERIHRFDNDQKRLAAALAGIGAVALQNVRLYSRVFQSEDALRKNERLTTLGLLSAEIAHEIRNPLTVLKLLLGGIGHDFPEGDPRRTDMRVIGEKLDQLEAIVARVLGFGKAPTTHLLTRCALGEVVTDTLTFVRLKLAQSKVQLRSNGPAQPVFVDCHRGQLQQALLNLIFNSMHAMPAGGTLTVECGQLLVEDQMLAYIDVRDTGHGIPEHLRARVFESFLSGRPDGTGLGLAITRRIMQGHHGDLALVDTGEQGTTMRLTLPLAKH